MEGNVCDRNKFHEGDDSSLSNSTSSSASSTSESTNSEHSSFEVSPRAASENFSAGENVAEYRASNVNPPSRVTFSNASYGTRLLLPTQPTLQETNVENHDDEQGVGPVYNLSSAAHDSASTHRLEDELGNYQYENALLKTELAHEVELRRQEVQQLMSRHRLELVTAERERDEAVADLQNLQSSSTLNERKLHERSIGLQQKLEVTTEELSRVKDELADCRRGMRQQTQCHATANITRDTDLANEKAAAGAARAEAVKLQERLDAEKLQCDQLRIKLQEQASLQRRLDDVQQQCREQVESAQAEVDQLRQGLHHQQQQHRVALAELEEKLSRAEERELASQRGVGAREDELLSQLQALRELKQRADSQVVQLKEQLLNAQQVVARGGGDGQYRAQPQPPMLQQVQELTDQLHKLQTENIALQLSEKEHAETAAELKSAQDQLMSLRKQLSQLKGSSAAQQHTIATLSKDLADCQAE